jgi:hypothetical protein
VTKLVVLWEMLVVVVGNAGCGRGHVGRAVGNARCVVRNTAVLWDMLVVT